MTDDRAVAQAGGLPEGPPLIRVGNLSRHFTVRGTPGSNRPAVVRAVQDVSFHVGHGETLGLVGESGCGKSTVGRLLVRLIEPTSGTVHLEDVEVTALPPRQLRSARRDLQFIFQDPMSSLDPRMSVERIVMEPLLVQGWGSAKDRRDRVDELLRRVGLPTESRRRFPHEFSGGQRQRIGIARALASRPRFIVCDEAVSALDVSIQAQIINLLRRLQDELGVSYLFIAHDLSVVRHISARVAVMYLGRIMEIGTRRRLFGTPAHPYTQALLDSVPAPDPRRPQTEAPLLPGELPNPLDPPAGCVFHTRCPHVMPACRSEIPPLKSLGDSQAAACHLLA
jgi:oligopeptide/dipeptide ABC transporter ATP-binding protein